MQEPGLDGDGWRGSWAQPLPLGATGAELSGNKCSLASPQPSSGGRAAAPPSQSLLPTPPLSSSPGFLFPLTDGVMGRLGAWIGLRDVEDVRPVGSVGNQVLGWGGSLG